jgi:hypothetical protein
MDLRVARVGITQITVMVIKVREPPGQVALNQGMQMVMVVVVVADIPVQMVRVEAVRVVVMQMQVVMVIHQIQGIRHRAEPQLAMRN